MTLINFMFQCPNCEHSTEIYFETQFYPNEVFIEGNCSSCQQYRLLNNGDMGYRSDYPEPMYPPWQLQCVNINKDKRICQDCSKHIFITIKDAEPVCYECNNTMMYVSADSNKPPESLKALINRLSM